MTSPYAPMLGTLTRQRGVLGSLLVSERDGIAIDSTLHVGIKGSVLAALAASLFRKARLSSRAAGLGDATFLTLEAEKGRLFVSGRGDFVLITIADSRANVGLIRVEMLRAVENLA